MTNDKQRLRSIIGPCVSGCHEGLLKKSEILNLQTERYAQREMEGGGGGKRNQFKPRAWSLESERERMQGG